MKRCVLDDTKLCTDCGECDRCDLDPNKLCDSCCKCLETEPFTSVPVADIVTQQASSYLREYFSNADDEEEFEIPYNVPDAKLTAEWEERLRAYEEREKQHIPHIRGVRKRTRTD